MKQNQYNNIVRQFIQEEKGCLVLVSDDPIFFKNLAAAFRFLTIDHHLIYRFTSLNNAVAQKKIFLKQYNQVLLMIEAYIQGRSNVLQFNLIKSAFKEQCKIISLSHEIERQYIIQMFEMGADNVIVKPISMNSLIQKIATTINPGSSWAQKVDECKYLINANKLEEAEKIADSFLSQKPNSAIALILKGDIYLKKEDFAQAEYFYKQASAKNPIYLEPLQKLADLYELIDAFDKKLKILKKMDNLSSVNHQRKIEIGHTYIQLNQEEEAKEYFQKAIKQVEKQAKDMLSNTYMEIAHKIKEKRPDICSHYIAKAIEVKGTNLSRKDLWMFNEIGISLRRQNKWEEAIRYYKKALEIAPLDPGLHYNIGMAYAQGKKFYKAVEYFQKSLEIAPDIINENPTVPFNIAKAYHEIKKNDQAIKFLRKALKLKPNFTAALKLMEKIKG
ncbi:tetratricopeptide repeat protein [Desulfovulcanus sp.]